MNWLSTTDLQEMIYAALCPFFTEGWLRKKNPLALSPLEISQKNSQETPEAIPLFQDFRLPCILDHEYDAARSGRTIPQHARHFICLRQAHHPVPELDDLLNILGETYRLCHIETDPAQASWRLEGVPIVSRHDPI